MSTSAFRANGVQFGPSDGTVYAPTFGTRGDGTTDDTTALANAYAAVPTGGKLIIPAGKYKITTTLTWNRPVSVEGAGVATILWIALADPTKQGIIIGAPYATSNINYQTFRNFSVQGATGSCVNGLAVYGAYRSRFENVHVRPGSTKQAVIVAGSLISYFNFIVSDEGISGTYDPTAGDWQGAGVMVADLRNGTPSVAYPGGTVMPTNACTFDLVIEGGSQSGGVVQEAQDQGGGNNVFRGTLEGFSNSGASAVKGAGYTVKIEGGLGFSIKDVHAELSANGVAIDSAQKFSIRDSLFAPIPSETMTITNSTDFVLDNNGIGALSVDTTNARWTISRCMGGVSGYTQSLINTTTLESFYDSSTSNTYRVAGIGQASGGNLIPSGNLARWPLSSAEMTFLGSNPTLTLTGEGLGDTTQRFYKQAVKVVGANNGFILSVPVPNSARYAGQPVTLWADVKNTGATDIYVGAYYGAAFHQRGIAKAGTGWQRIGITVFPTSTDLQITFTAVTNAAYTFYLGGYGAVVGDTMPSGIDAPYPSSADGILLSGQKIQMGTAAPVSGTWAVGDTVINSVPTATGTGAAFAWQCTVAGTPGTWVAMGVLAGNQMDAVGANPLVLGGANTTVMRFRVASASGNVASLNSLSAFDPPTTDTGSLGESALRWGQVWATAYATKNGGVLASATTISPTSGIHHISGTTPIATINLPYTGFVGSIVLMPDAAFTTTTGGNIYLVSTAVVNKALIMTYDGTKWSPSY